MQSFLLAGPHQSARGCTAASLWGQEWLLWKSGTTLCAVKLLVPLNKGQTVESQDDIHFSPKSSAAVDRELQAVPQGPSSLVHMVETESGHCLSCRKEKHLESICWCPE